jgi:hypothetical protein
MSVMQYRNRTNPSIMKAAYLYRASRVKVTMLSPGPKAKLHLGFLILSFRVGSESIS